MYNQIKNFLDEYKHKGMAENTVKTYEIHLRHYYSYLKQNNLDYRTIKPKDIRNYTKASANRGDSNNTINVRLSAIKTFYDYLIEQEYIDHNPIIKTIYLQGKTTKTKPLTEQEKSIILSYIEQKDDHIRLGFYTMFYTGLRVSELANLKREDVNIINNRVTVHVIHGKRGGERTVPVFDPEVAAQLLEYTEEQHTDPLFKVKARTFQYHAEQASIKTGIPFSVHQARHTFATERLQEGIRLDILQKLMGHKDISTTMLYARTMDIDVINSAEPIRRGIK
jgi:site-specific recombinase XerD